MFDISDWTKIYMNNINICMLDILILYFFDDSKKY